MAELMLGQPLFPGESGIDQLVEIIKVLGTPTREQIRTMNPNYMEHKFPQIKPHPFTKVENQTFPRMTSLSFLANQSLLTFLQVFRKASPDAIDLISLLLEYTPTQRLSAIDAMVHPFFDELRTPECRFPDSRHAGGPSKDMPRLFDFTRHGMLCSESDDIDGETCADVRTELSIAPDKNSRLVPAHARKELQSRGLDIDNFTPMTPEEMAARLD